MTNEAKKPFHVIALDATNFKGIEAIHIDPKSGKPVILSGDNEAGKSSILDAIEFAFTGKNVSQPLRKGSKRGQVILDLGDSEQTLKITRKITASGDNLILTGPDGASMPKAQTVLNGMFKAITIDPLDFMDQEPKEQAETLKEMLGLTETLDALSAQEKVAFDNRATKNAEVKTLQAQFDAIVIPPGTPEKPVDVVGITTLIEQHNAIISSAEKAMRNYRDAAREQGTAENLVIDLANQIAALQARLDAAKKLAETAKLTHAQEKEKADKLAGEAEDATKAIEALKQQLGNAQSINTAVANKARKAELRKTLATATAAADALTATIKKKRDAKLIAVQQAKLPVEGLEITDDGIMFEGIPLQDINTAKKIRVCCALAMAEKPDVRVLFIREGALANTETKETIFAVARENGFQVWMENFSEKPLAGAIHIVEGEIAVNGQEE